MRKRVSIVIAAILFVCGALTVWALQRPPTLRADYDWWPIGMNGVVREIAMKARPCKLTIEKEFTPGEPGGISYGCLLVAQDGSLEDRNQAVLATVDAICRALEGKGCRVVSTDSKSCKEDYQIVYVGPTGNGTISLKKFGDQHRREIGIRLEVDQPHAPAKQAGADGG